MRRQWHPLAALIALPLLAGGALTLTGSAPVQAQRFEIGPLTTQGPVGITKGDGVLVGLLLPAVQVRANNGPADQKPAPLPVNVTLRNAETGQTLAQQQLQLIPGGPAGFVRVEAFGDGSVRFLQQTVATLEGENQRLEIVAEGVVLQNPKAAGRITGSVQLYDLETGKTREVITYSGTGLDGSDI